MRLLLLASLLAVPASAQTSEAPPLIPLSASTAAVEAEPLPALTTADLLGESDAPAAPRRTSYGSLTVSGGLSGRVGLMGTAVGRFGVETPSGVRFGAVGIASTLGSASSVALGPEVSLRRDLGQEFTLRSSGQATVGLSTSAPSSRPAYSSSRLSAGGVLDVEREIPVVGSVRLVPRLGVFATAGRFSAVPDLGFEAQTHGAAGFRLGADVRFRVFGRDALLSTTLPLVTTGTGYAFDGFGQPLAGMTFGLEF